MVKVKRANVRLTINEKDVEKYVARGFSVLDEEGNVVRSGNANDLPFLKEAYIKHEEKIAELEARNALLVTKIEELTAELNEARQKKSKSKKVEE